eukprot:TRINITY_DN70930_c1_g1_i1.p1 TRINITY_DN70930_c1_g1~~TRINITY_DN70930_c1_g1_i1.p1  ORF type:complete len:735 (+),score=55.14 TRINITY_DN70930_c1_g1_i1:89-2293(+)
MEALPKEFYCPITQELMKDPVIGPDGQTYERSAITDWLKTHGTSPITREPMDPKQLVPNRALKATIEDMLTGKKPIVHHAPAASAPKPASADLDLQLSAVSDKDNSGYLHLSVAPPENGTRHPCAFICVLDVSGSMDEAASLEAGVETANFSRLDLVKHSVKTVINMLSPDDYLALISFNEAASVVLQLTKMTEMGKSFAITSVEGLNAGGHTNIWDALRMSTNLSRLSPVCNSINSCILLFTDGEPNVNPPRGIIKSLNNLLKDKERHFSIHTFGYGYQLDSELLLEIANIGHGAYNYIPDCTMVGTTFVNFLSNALATAVRNAKIEIKAEGVGKVTGVGYEIAEGKIVVGFIEYGQPRDFIIRFETTGYSNFSFTAKLLYDGKSVERTLSAFYCEDAVKFNLALSRALYCEALFHALGQQISVKQGSKVLTAIKSTLKSLPTKDHEIVKAFIRDMESSKDSEGQVGKAFSKAEWFDKWGKHYIRSLGRAHQLQECHNFKDPGVQVYGGKLFKELQDKTDEIFCTLPAPKPTAKILPSGKPIPAPVAPRAVYAPVNMHAYMDYGAGCFDGEGKVQLSNGTFKKIKELLKGDEIMNSDGKVCKVVALVVISLNCEIDLINLNSVLITPWHPVRVAREWKFPHDLKPAEKHYCSKIYNLVLDQHHIATINNVDVVTLGHGFKENTVIEHAYFGTQKVIEDLKRYPGWENGNVVIKTWTTVRDQTTGLVQGLINQH